MSEETEAGKGLNIYQRLLVVMAEAGSIAKGRGKGVDYPFHKIDDVVGALQPALIAGRVWMRVTPISMALSVGTQETKYGPKTVNIADAVLDVTFINVDSPEDVDGPHRLEGQGFDYSDKHAGKAWSYALKPFLMATFNLRGAPENEDGNIETATRPPASSGPPSDWKPNPAAAVKPKPAAAKPKPKPDALGADPVVKIRNPKFKTWPEWWKWIDLGYQTADMAGEALGEGAAVEWLALIAERLGWSDTAVTRVIRQELGIGLDALPLISGDGDVMQYRIWWALEASDTNVVLGKYDEDAERKMTLVAEEFEQNGSVDPQAETLDAMSVALMSFAGIKWTADEEGEGEEKKLELAAWEALQAALVVTVGMDLPRRSDKSLAKLTDKILNGGRDDGAVKDLVHRRLGGVAGGMTLHELPEYIVPTLLKVLATFPAAKLAGDISGDQVGIDDLSVNAGAGEANYEGSEG